MKKVREKLKQLKDIAGMYSSCAIMSHNNPDPDGIVSAILLKQLLKGISSIRVTLLFGGMIGRAENQALLEYSQENFKRFTKSGMNRAGFLALVDTQAEAGNNPVEPEDNPLVVFDHHTIRPTTRKASFYLVRSDVGATVTLVYQIFEAAGLEIDARLATMITYALQSETADLQKEASALDRALYEQVYPSSDKHALHTIRYPKVDTDYFVSIHSGIEEAVLYGDIIIIPLGPLTYPDVVAEVADYFLRYRPVNYSIAIGSFRRELLFSIRSANPKKNLGRMAQRVVEDIGTAGGHGTMAGGQIPVAPDSPKDANKLQSLMIERFLRELKAHKRKPVPLLKRMYKPGS